MYTSKLYRLLVYLYVPVALLIPFIIDQSIVITLIISILIIYILYDFPDIFGAFAKPDTIIAKRDGPLVHLFLEEDYFLDLTQFEEVRVSTGVFPISPVKLEAFKPDGTILTLTSYVYSSKLINFLQELRPVQVI